MNPASGLEARGKTAGNPAALFTGPAGLRNMAAHSLDSVVVDGRGSA